MQTPAVPTEIPIAETFRTKLVALWYVIGSFLSLLVALATIAMTLFTLGYGSADEFMLVAYGVIAVTFLYLAIVLYKISSAMHRMEIVAYRSARLLFLFNIAGSTLGVATAVLMKFGTPSVIVSVFSLTVNLIFFFMLTSERPMFVREGKRSLYVMSVIALVMLSVNTVAGVFVQWYLKTQSEAEMKRFTQELKAQAEKARQKNNAEPAVSTWTTYTDKQFPFAIEMPANWDVRTYASSSAPGDNFTIIAFAGRGVLGESKDMAVQRTHTHIRVSPVSDQQEYKYFQMRMSQIGKSGYTAAELGGIRGVDNTMDIAVEYNGFIYEFTGKILLDANENYYRSAISERMKDSFAFNMPVSSPAAEIQASPSAMMETVSQ